MKYGYYYIITKNGAECLNCEEEKEKNEKESNVTRVEPLSSNEEKPDVS